MPEPDCIFCKIVAGEIPSTKIYEDDTAIGFLDINPVSKGHTLLIPKAHHQMMIDTPDELVAKLFVTTKKILKAIQAATKSHLVGVSVMGDEVPHFHIHLIPRHADDGLSGWSRGVYIENEKEEIAAEIKKFV